MEYGQHCCSVAGALRKNMHDEIKRKEMKRNDNFEF